MALFHMNRYWSEEENQEDEENQNQEKILKDKLKNKLKKRKSHEAKNDTEITVEDKTQIKEEEDPIPSNEAPAKKKRKKNKKKTKETVVDTGFTVLGQNVFQKKKVQRVLPEWLTNPDIVSVDFKEDQLAVEDMEGLDKDIVEALKKHNVNHFFPVQRQVIPRLLTSSSCFRPNDLCVSAPTGSGKTLAFVLPIVHCLRHRVVVKVRALVILPVQDLATQVYKVFQSYCEGTTLKVKLLSSSKTFADEQRDLVRKGILGQFHSMADIIVATPGRLVDHIQRTEGFSLEHLRYLIIDEADRVMEDIQNDWLQHVENAVYAGKTFSRGHLQSPLNVANSGMLPLQKLLFSATLSQNPEQLQELNLFEPKLFTSVVKPKDILHNENPDEEDITQYHTPAELKESYIICEDSLKKPLLLHHLIVTMKMKKTLIFTKSVDHTHVLAVLLKAFGHKVAELSSKIQQNRSRVLSQLSSGAIDLLVCSDALARGIDIGKIDFVISYDSPKFIKTYIHRVGRTARAGEEGKTITIVEGQKEERTFKAMMKAAGKVQMEKMDIGDDLQDGDKFDDVQSQVKQAMMEEKKNKKSKKVKGKGKGKKEK